MASPEPSNWLFDCTFDDIPVPGGDFPAPPTGFNPAPPTGFNPAPPTVFNPAPATGFNPASATAFNWSSQPLNFATGVSADGSYGDSDGLKETGSRKRVRSETCSASGSKACREKMRRDRLNERFLELGAIMEPGRPPKIDKVAILSDAVRMVTQLRGEAQKLKDSNENLHEKIKELKAEKNELRDEKQRLKAEKEKLEQQVKTMSFVPHPAAYGAQGQGGGNKLMPFISYPGVAMWQFMPPAAVDTSQDHVLRPPVA